MSNPSVWLETNAEITNVALAIMRSDFELGLNRAKRAVQLAEQSGRAAARRATLANLGYLLYLTGHFDEAADHYSRAMDALPSHGDNTSAALDGIAQIRLARGQIDEAAQLLECVSESISTPRDRRLYGYRHSQMTYTHLLMRRAEWDAALESADSLARLADESGDHLLQQIAFLTKAELLQQLGRIPEAMQTLDVVVQTLAQQPPDLWAHYERILACALLEAGDRDAATLHLQRARRLYESIRSVPGSLELSRRWDETESKIKVPAEATDPLAPAAAPVATARDVLQTAAGLLRHHSRPELLAREFVNLLAETDCVAEARVLSIGKDEPQVLAAATGPGGPAEGCLDRRISIGFARDRAVELDLKVRPDIGAQATVHAVTLLLATIQDLERAQAEREERISLWPIDEDGVEAGQAVVGGQMRALMANAKRIAGTNVSVFITGESGTGKEILARAIHRYSDRAAKPFIPFNCTAVPRDMLESHLFGHRRGSFTGADRDHPGLIGAARDGTLFLDEIGELGLDLQPKLLRFLESSEICPIGEATPFTINVRIVAATNAHVEQQVKEGRFREDLFYRLNVIRLKIPPLRERRDEIPALVRHFVDQFAGEFRKGDVRVSEETMEHLLLCRWPGNVRQLQNEIRRMVALAEPHSVLTPGDLSEDVYNSRLAARPIPSELEMLVGLKDQLPPTVAKIEREMIRLALRDHHSNLDAAARALGISRKGLYLKRQRLGL
jgi:DNA-binding NtrC family response regulator/tetratricopeptide (TPR) repeat protein